MSYPLSTEDALREAKAAGSGFFLTAAQVEAVLYDLGTLREANRDWRDQDQLLREDLSGAHAALREAEQVRDFALGTADILLEQRDKLTQDLAVSRESRAFLTVAFENAMEQLEAQTRELALADLRLAEVQFDRGLIELHELHDARDHAKMCGASDIDIATRWDNL